MRPENEAIRVENLVKDYGAAFFVGAAVATALLVYEHRLVVPGDYRRLDAAFFAMNGIISAAVMVGAVADAVLR